MMTSRVRGGTFAASLRSESSSFLMDRNWLLFSLPSVQKVRFVFVFYMSLFACGSIHQCHERFSKRSLCVWLLYFMNGSCRLEAIHSHCSSPVKANHLHSSSPVEANHSYYYPTALRRVQITPKTSTNITRYLYSRGPVRQVFSQRASDELDWSYEKKICQSKRISFLPFFLTQILKWKTWIDV